MATERNHSHDAWRAFETAIAPDDDAAARVWQRVHARIDDAGEDVAATPLRRAAAALFIVKSSGLAVAIAGGTLLALELVAAAVRPPVPPPAVAVPTVVEAESRSPADPQPQILPPLAAPVVAMPTTVSAAPVVVQQPSAAVAVKAKPEAAATRSREDALRAEIALVDRARTALKADRFADAIDLLEQHARQFPNGGFVEDRRAMLAVAACRSARADAAALARGFAADYPKSAQLVAVRAACKGIAIDAMDSDASPQ